MFYATGELREKDAAVATGNLLFCFVSYFVGWLIDFHRVYRQEMIQRAEGRKADQTAHAQLVQSNYNESLARHEYAAQHPAYADGRVWWAGAEGPIRTGSPLKLL